MILVFFFAYFDSPEDEPQDSNKEVVYVDIFVCEEMELVHLFGQLVGHNHDIFDKKLADEREGVHT